MAGNPNSIGNQGRVPLSFGLSQLAPGQRAHGLPAVLNQPLQNWWLHAGRKRRAIAYAEKLRAVGVSYAPMSTFARVLRPGAIARLDATDSF
jgi:hypothetical protein